MSRVKKDLKNIRKRESFLKVGITKALTQSGFKVIRHLKSNWIRGIGGDGSTMDGLKEPYKTYKRKKGRKPIPDLTFTGLMQQSLNTKMLGRLKAIVTFSQAEMKKDRGNAKLRPNMMKVSDRFQDIILRFVLKQMRS